MPFTASNYGGWSFKWNGYWFIYTLGSFFSGYFTRSHGTDDPFHYVRECNNSDCLFLITTRRENNIGFLGLGIVIGSIAKYLVLSQSVAFLVSVPPPVAKMMQFPQLITALVGGVIAIVIKQALGRTNFFKNQS